MRRLTDSQKIELVEKYITGKYTLVELDRFYNVSQGSVASLLRHRGVKINNDRPQLHRKYNIDQHYFDIIDTEAKAYFLGLLYADGNTSSKSNRIVLQLQERDKSILDKFNIALNYNKSLDFMDMKRLNPNNQNSYRLTIFSKVISERLIELGCVPAKSLILEFPTEGQVPNYLLRHFIRGVWDGDGSWNIYYTKDKGYAQHHCNITTTRMFCNQLKILVEKELDIHCTVSSILKCNPITNRWSVGGRRQVYKFLEWIYKDATLFIERKYDAFISDKNKYKTGKLIRD